MQVIDISGCRVGTFFVITSDPTGKDLAYGPYYQPEVAQREAKAKLGQGFKNTYVAEVNNHYRTAVTTAEVVNGQ